MYKYKGIMRKEIYILVTIIGLALLLIGVEYDALLCIVGAVLEISGISLLLMNIYKKSGKQNTNK